MTGDLRGIQAEPGWSWEGFEGASAPTESLELEMTTLARTFAQPCLLSDNQQNRNQWLSCFASLRVRWWLG